MKYAFFLSIVLALGCSNSVLGQTASMHHTKKEEVRISTWNGLTYDFSKTEFNRIVDSHPEFFYEYPIHPDLAYAAQADVRFRSEAGCDQYYVLYAYFLKQRVGFSVATQRYRQLASLYDSLNSLFAQIQYGGTYFGHQSSRIDGYSAYAVYTYAANEQSREKAYDIAKQKKLYIQALKQLIDDEMLIDQNRADQLKKQERSRALNKIVDKIEMLITDLFYLRRAQAFQYEYYTYY